MIFRRAVRALAMVAWALPAGARGAPLPSKGERVVIDAERIGVPISPRIYGQFIEHLGRCIYGGLWEDRAFKARNLIVKRRD
jgi:alpha-N-arabinofuranosidase